MALCISRNKISIFSAVPWALPSFFTHRAGVPQLIINKLLLDTHRGNKAFRRVSCFFRGKPTALASSKMRGPLVYYFPKFSSQHLSLLYTCLLLTSGGVLRRCYGFIVRVCLRKVHSYLLWSVLVELIFYSREKSYVWNRFLWILKPGCFKPRVLQANKSLLLAGLKYSKQ